MFGIQPVFEDLTTGLYRFQPLLPNILAVSLTGLFLIDTVVSVKAALPIGNRLEQLEKLGAVLKEHLENLEPVSYTHLDVYKRQPEAQTEWEQF